MRTQYAHIIDMVPTVLDVLGIEPPATIKGVPQSPIQGVSFAHTFDDADAPTADHHTQYFEMIGHRSIYHDGWRAVCPWPGPSFAEAGKPFGAPISADTLSRARRHRLGALPRRRGLRREPQRGRRQPRPADRADRHLVRRGRQVQRPARRRQRRSRAWSVEQPLLAAPRDRYVYYPDTQSVPYFAAPKVLNRPHSITADVEIPEGGAEGVLLCQGAVAGGYSLLHEGRQAALRPQLRRPRLLQGGVRPGVGARAGTSCASSSNRPASWTCSRARDAPADSSSTSTATLVGETDVPYTTPMSSTRAR